MKQEELSGPACKRCGSLVTEDMKLCSCGYPTVYMTFEERAKFEVQRWRAYQEQDRVQSA